MRTFTEWLVVPLLLLPLLAGAGVVLWAQDAHRRAQAPFRQDGAATASAWLAPGGAARWMVDDGVFRTTTVGEPILCTCPLADAEVLVTCATLGTAPWSFSAELPSPLSPALLADPRVRLALDTGLAPVDVEGAAPGAVALRTLLDHPDVVRLRDAPLPCATKRYVLARWREQGAQGPALDEAEELLRLFGGFLALVEWPRGPLTRGWHERAGLCVYSYGPHVPAKVWGSPPSPTVIPRTEAFSPSELVENGGEESAASLHWLSPGVSLPPGRVLWQGRLESPLAGTFAFEARWRAWWQAPWVRRWAGPVLALLLAALLLPLALFVSIRRRRRLDDARVRFLNEMAHDLRTPLASLRLHADMLSQGRGRPEKQADYLRLLSREAARLSSLLANLLDLSRLERHERRLESGALDVGDHAYRAAREFLLLHPERAEDLRVEGPEDTWARADATALARCLANLLENAGKFTAPGTAVRLTWAADGDQVLVRVADEGPGIARGERERIFERYARGRTARRDGVPGTGLGLSLVKELVEGMGGSVALESSERGAAFALRLPGARRD